jgi:hypothetical protein
MRITKPRAAVEIVLAFLIPFAVVMFEFAAFVRMSMLLETWAYFAVMVPVAVTVGWFLTRITRWTIDSVLGQWGVLGATGSGDR